MFSSSVMAIFSLAMSASRGYDIMSYLRSSDKALAGGVEGTRQYRVVSKMRRIRSARRKASVNDNFAMTGIVFSTATFDVQDDGARAERIGKTVRAVPRRFDLPPAARTH